MSAVTHRLAHVGDQWYLVELSTGGVYPMHAVLAEHLLKAPGIERQGYGLDVHDRDVLTVLPAEPPEPPRPPTCGSCRFYQPRPPRERRGQCRRYPPVASPNVKIPLVYRPWVDESDWCGEYRRAETP